MGAPTPQLLLEAIASGAGGGFITNPMPNNPTSTNAASVEGGFPPITMQSELAGGEPPLGQDMNGFMFLITSHTLYVECGQLYTYNSTLAAAIGGYLAGTVLGMTDGTGMWLCTENGNTSDPDAGGAGWAPIAAYGTTTVAVTGGTVALTPAQAKYGVIILTGILASNLVLQLPQYLKEWLIINNTTGAFTTTVNTTASGSSGVNVPQGGFTAPVGVYSVADGNIYPTVAPLSLNISVAPTANSIVQRSNAGYVLAIYFNTSAGADNLAPSTVFTNSGDGYIRQNTLTNFESFLNLAGFAGQVSNGQVPYSAIAQWATTFFNSATLTGDPTAPTAAPGTNTTQIATTAFVAAALGAATFAGGNGANTQSSVPLGNGAILKFGQTPFFTGANLNVAFNAAFPNIGYVAFVIGVNTSNDVYPTSAPSTAGFTINGGSAGITCLWFAIGR